MLLDFILSQFVFGYAVPVYTVLHVSFSFLASMTGFAFLTPAIMASCTLAIAAFIASAIIYKLCSSSNDQKSTFSLQ